jgi:hypothetical protein
MDASGSRYFNPDIEGGSRRISLHHPAGLKSGIPDQAKVPPIERRADRESPAV